MPLPLKKTETNRPAFILINKEIYFFDSYISVIGARRFLKMELACWGLFSMNKISMVVLRIPRPFGCWHFPYWHTPFEYTLRSSVIFRIYGSNNLFFRRHFPCIFASFFSFLRRFWTFRVVFGPERRYPATRIPTFFQVWLYVYIFIPFSFLISVIGNKRF